MLRTKPLDSALGIEITGFDPASGIDDTLTTTIETALLDHHLVCLRCAPLTPTEFVRLARGLGEPQLQLLRDARDADVPEVSVFDSTYKTAAAKPADLKLDRRSGWHTDDSYFAEPAKVTLLQALEIPERGGETRFCNAQAAYRDLSAADKSAYAELRAVHSYDTRRAPARAQARKPEEQADTRDVEHPLIRTHEVTGAKAIYFNSNRTDRIVGMDRRDSDAVLDHIHAHMTRPQYQYHHRWRRGDILIWDNRSVIHSVNMDFPVGQRRIHQRILLRGGVPR